ncbi:hypothetical protein [Candidatus Palibaumannia cicadellinicola]|nr:hypothetical protein [Candidatus Baumannia cicadellinicola]
MLKIGILMQEKGHKDKANIIFNNLCKVYPSTNAANKAQAYIN